MKQKYITKEELKQSLYQLVDDFIGKLEEGDKINTLTIINEEFNDNLGVTYRNNTIFGNFVSLNYRVDQHNNRTNITHVLSNKQYSTYTTASREWLEEMEEKE